MLFHFEEIEPVRKKWELVHWEQKYLLNLQRRIFNSILSVKLFGILEKIVLPSDNSSFDQLKLFSMFLKDLTYASFHRKF